MRGDEPMAAEILAPAGNIESLQAAFAAGCDAVYFGLPNFGARAYANNFTLEQTREMIQQAHVLGIKIYITMNTMMYEDEIEEAYQCAKKLYEYGVDALIIQDLGFIHLLHHRLPDLELHASTQISVNHPKQIEQLKKIGVSRVVLARECTLEEIKACVDTGVEIEVFIHGALCISYSGQCQFSSVRYNRSGNRGMCAQPCRMTYELEKNGKTIDYHDEFLLSPRDLSLLDHADELEKLGVASLKIEGRMKSPEYVYTAVSKTKKVLEGNTLNEQDRQELMVTFNRGYTLGHAYRKTGLELMNMKTSNHQGIEIGKVTGVYKSRIQIRLHDTLAQNDGIRFESKNRSDGCYVNFMYDENNRLIREGTKNQTVEVEGPKGVRIGSIVRKTVDFTLQKEVQNQIQHFERQVPVFAKATCHGVGHPLILEVWDGKNKIKAESEEFASQAQKRETNAEVLAKQLSKTKDSWAYFDEISYDLQPGIYFSISSMNALRRTALDALKECRQKIICTPEQEYDWMPNVKVQNHIFAEIQNVSQKEDADQIEWVSESVPGTLKKAVLTQTNGDILSHFGDGKIIMNLNVSNSYAVAALLEMGYECIGLSEEMDADQCRNLMEGFEKRYHQMAPVFVTIYQKRRMMIMKHCPINTLVKDGTRTNCAECKTNQYILRGKDGREVLCLGDSQCNMRLFDASATDLTPDLEMYKSIGIQSFYVNFVNESKDERIRVLQALTHPSLS